jgi:hypothetical protein
MLSSTRALWLLPLLPLALGCGAEATEPSEVEELAEVRGDGKSDDYLSPKGREYDVTGTATITLTGDDAALEGDALLARAQALVAAKVDAITGALEKKLAFGPTDNDLVVMLRAESKGHESLMSLAENQYSFAYKAEVGGPNDLLTRLPLERNMGLAQVTLDVDMTPVVLTLAPSVQTSDAYPRYREMFEGGLDLAIHVGGDHYDPRNDLDEAKAIYGQLTRLGLRAPVSDFGKLALDSGPFRGQIDVGGTKVDVRATLFHADMAPDDQLDKLIAAYKESARTADVVIYRGHAGTSLDYSGVVVHYNPRVAIPATEFRNLDLPEKYQVFVFDGCETYTGYADQLYQHPKKSARNADVITSVNYGSGLGGADTVLALLSGVLAKKNQTWFPHSWESLLAKINDAKTGSWLPIYGVHGLSDNPKLSPLANAEAVGRACTRNADCGAVDSLCMRRHDGSRTCGAACTADEGCPGGSKCIRVASAAAGDPRQCVSEIR